MGAVFPVITGIGRFGRLGVVLGSSNYLSAFPGSLGFPSGSAVKNLPAVQETWVQSLDREDPDRGHGNPFQYSGLKDPTDRGAWQAAVRRVTKSRTQLK